MASDRTTQQIEVERETRRIARDLSKGKPIDSQCLRDWAERYLAANSMFDCPGRVKT